MHNDPEVIRSIREFNRFYTNLLGLLDRAVHNSPYSQVENRVLFEIHSGATSARELRNRLRIDAGYLSRVLGRLEGQRLLRRVQAKTDGRQQEISLTKAGISVREMLDYRADEEIRGLIDGLATADQRALLAAVRSVRSLLESGAFAAEPVTIRPPHTGEFGWMLETFAVCYQDLSGWGSRAEAEAAAAIADSLTGGLENRGAWIAEVGGRPAGAALCTVDSDAAEVPFISVLGAARRAGAGTALLEACVVFARHNGASRVSIWVDADRTASSMLDAMALRRTDDVLLPQKHPVYGPRRRWAAQLEQRKQGLTRHGQSDARWLGTLPASTI